MVFSRGACGNVTGLSALASSFSNLYACCSAGVRLYRRCAGTPPLLPPGGDPAIAGDALRIGEAEPLASLIGPARGGMDDVVAIGSGDWCLCPPDIPVYRGMVVANMPVPRLHFLIFPTFSSLPITASFFFARALKSRRREREREKVRASAFQYRKVVHSQDGLLRPT